MAPETATVYLGCTRSNTAHLLILFCLNLVSYILARDAQAKLLACDAQATIALIVAQTLSICPSICPCLSATSWAQHCASRATSTT